MEKNFFLSGFFLFFAEKEAVRIVSAGAEFRFSQQNDNSVVCGKKKAADGRRTAERRAKERKKRRSADRGGRQKSRKRGRDDTRDDIGEQRENAGNGG